MIRGLSLTLLCTGILNALTPASAAETYKIDGVHSTILFRVKHMDVSYAYGRFNKVEGSFTLAPKPADMAFDATIEAESIDTENEARDKHLKGPDFFNTKQFPKILFKSTSIKQADAGAYEVTGNLTLHGVTKPITMSMKPVGTGKGMRGGYLAGLEGTTSFLRTDFGMKGMVGPVADEIFVTISLEGSRP